MTERWQNELKKLGGVDVPTGRIHARMAQEPSDEPAQGEPARSPRQRIVAGVVAFAVFGAAGVFAYGALKPLGGGGTGPAGGGALPNLMFNVTVVGGTPAPGATSSDFSLGLTFGEASLSLPALDGQAGPVAWVTAVTDPPPLDIALTSGATVRLTSGAESTDITLTKEGSSYPLTDGATVPAPGTYGMDVGGQWVNASGWARWVYTVDVVPPGTMQFFSPTGNGIQANPSQAAAPGVVPDIQMLIDGRLFAGGVAQNSGVIYGTGAQIAPGAPVWVSSNVTAAFSSLTASSLSTHARIVIGGSSPPGQIGTADLTPGDYMFGVSAKGTTWEGDLSFPVTVVSGESSSPQPSPSWSGETLVVKLQTTLASKSGCPGWPDGVASFAGSDRKLNGNSFTWTCPDGSSAVYDATAPTFVAAKDFISVPQGTRLLLEGDFTTATGSLLDGTGTYPWPNLQDYGDLVGGVSLQADPGRYVVAIAATWPEGTRLFWVPVEIVAPSSATPSPSVSAASEVRINCDGGAPQIADPTVAVQPDGIHVRIVGNPPANTGIAFYNRSTGQATLPDPFAANVPVVWTIPPGTFDVKCYPMIPGVHPATINAAATVRVIDPNGYFISAELDCPAPDRLSSPNYLLTNVSAETSIRDTISGLLATDLVEHTGYPGASFDARTYRIVRGGKTIATATFGKDSISQIYACPDAGLSTPPVTPVPSPPF